jgi:hypothetical protein
MFPPRFLSNGQSRRRSSLAALGVLGVLLAAWPLDAALAADKLRFASVADFNRCIDKYLAAPETCLEVLQAFVKTKPQEAFAAGKAVRAQMNHAAAVPFFAKALAKAGDKKLNRCADPDVAMAVGAGLEMPASGNPIVADALALVGQCWADLQAPLSKALTESGPSGYLAENLCPRLAERKVTNGSCEKKPAPVAAPEPKWKDLDPKAATPEGPAKVFKGDQGRTLTMVKLKGEEAYLIRFDGFRGEWNGRVVLHRESAVGSGYDYFTQVKGARWVGVVVRDGSTEAHPVGDKGPFLVGYDEAASKATSAQNVLDQFRKQPKM